MHKKSIKLHLEVFVQALLCRFLSILSLFPLTSDLWYSSPIARWLISGSFGYDLGVSYTFHFCKKNAESSVIFLWNGVLILYGKENKEATAICFEIRKKNKELLRKVPSKIYGSNFIMENNKTKFWFVNISDCPHREMGLQSLEVSFVYLLQLIFALPAGLKNARSLSCKSQTKVKFRQKNVVWKKMFVTYNFWNACKYATHK